MTSVSRLSDKYYKHDSTGQGQMAEWEARYGSGAEGTDRSPAMGVGGAREPADGLVELHLTGGVQASPSGVHLRAHTHTLACALPSLKCPLVDFLSVTGYTHTQPHTLGKKYADLSIINSQYSGRDLSFTSRGHTFSFFEKPASKYFPIDNPVRMDKCEFINFVDFFRGQ